jgi:DNA-binding CsgD family transcriptional regulator
MERISALLDVVERLYAATLTPAEWPDAMTAVQGLFGSGHVILRVLDGSTGSVDFGVNSGIDQASIAHMATPEAAELAMPLFMKVPPGTAILRQQVVADQAFERSAFYNEFLRPVNGYHGVAAYALGAQACFDISICRPRTHAAFDEGDASRLQLLLPHLSTAIALQGRLRGLNELTNDLSGLLDRVDEGVIVTDSAARVISLNVRASRLVAEADGLGFDGARLKTATPAGTQALRAAIGAVAAQSQGFERSCRLPRPSGRLPLRVTLIPLWRLDGSARIGRSARVALFIKESDGPRAIDREAVADVFHLTTRESEIAALLASGADLEAIAAGLGIGLGTVRHHLKRLFDKTDTHSQPALIARLMGFTDRG